MSYPKPYTLEDLNRYEVIPTEFRSYISGQRLIATVEALERAERERDEQLEDSERIIAALVRERDEALKRFEDLKVHRASCCDANEQRAEKAEADAARLREALTTIERTGAPGATIVARRSSDEHSCSWCRGMVTPCPVVTAHEALKGGG